MGTGGPTISRTDTGLMEISKQAEEKTKKDERINKEKISRNPRREQPEVVARRMDPL